VVKIVEIDVLDR